MKDHTSKSDSKSYFRIAFFIFIALAALLFMLVSLGIFGTSHPHNSQATSSSNSQPNTREPNQTHSPEQQQNHFPLKGVSLSDTQIEPFNITKGANGWVLPPNLRYYFEYFIQLQGEIPLNKIKQLVKQDLTKKHPPELSQYLYDLFLRYLDYRQAIDELVMYENDLENSASDSDQEHLSQEHVSRERQLQEQVKALQHLNMDTINDQVETIQADYFNEAERKALFDETFLEQYSDKHTIKPKLDAYDEIKNTLKGDELQAARITLFGSEAANRLQQLDQKRETWKNRLIDLQCAEIAIAQSTGLSPKDKNRQQLDLLTKDFSDTEIRRIDALRRNQLLPKADCY